MKEWIVRYVAYSGNIVSTTITADINTSEEEIIEKAYADEVNYSSDCIFQIIDVN